MVEPNQNPYVGPRTFEEQDAPFFFGREREARDLLWLVMSEPLVLFYAPSGAGKSSLINTRLVPGLRGEGFEVLPTGRVSGELPESITQVSNIYLFNLLLSLDQSQEEASYLTHISLSDYLGGHEADPSQQDGSAQPARVLIIDQFEEIFTAHLDRWQERDDFFRQLRQAIRRDPMLWVVLALREDYVAALDPYARSLPGKLRARFHMQRMGYQAALEAVKKPAEGRGRPFASGVAETLVDNLRQIRVHGQARPQLGEFVEPVQLQVVCYQLWEDLKERPPAEITHQDLKELGDVDTALAQFYEAAIARVLSETGESEIELRSWFEHQLITEAGTRGTVYRGPEKTRGMANRAVELLANQFLLRAEIRAGGTWYELVHDRFIDPILQANLAWGARQSDLVRAALAWDASDRVKDNLYRGGQLKAALVSVSLTNVSLTSVRGQKLEPLVSEFLAASEKFNQALEEKEVARQRELEHAQALAEVERRRAKEQAGANRRLRRLAVALVAVFLLALIAAILAWSSRQQALAQGQVAEAEAVARATAQAQAEARRAQAEAAQATAEAEAAARAIAQAQAEVRRAEADVAKSMAEVERDRAEQQARIALSRELATDATNILAIDPELGLLLATEAMKTERSVQAEDALRQALASPWRITLRGHTDFATSAAYSPDGRWIVTASWDGTARVWDARRGQQRMVLESNAGRVWSAAYSPDGRWILTANEDNMARIWNAESGQLQMVLQGHMAPVRSAAYSSDGRWIVTAGEDGTARVWDAESGQQKTVLKGHTYHVLSAAYSPDGRRIVTAAQDGTARVWDVDSGQQKMVLGEATDLLVSSAVYSPDGRWIVTAGGGSVRVRDTSGIGSVRVWDAESGQQKMVLESNAGYVWSAAYSPDGRWIVTASEGSTAQVWDAESGQQKMVLQGHTASVRSAVYSPDGRWVVTAGFDGTVQVWDAEGGQQNMVLKHTSAVESAAYSPDGQRIVTATRDEIAQVWDAENGEGPRVLLRGHTGPVLSAAYSPDGHWIVTASEDKTARVWNAQSGRQEMELRGHTDIVNWAAYSPDGRWIVTVSKDNTARVWDAQSGQQRLKLEGHPLFVNSAAYSPDGRWLVTTGGDRVARVWDAETGKPKMVLEGHADYVSSAVYSPDGRWILTASADRTARVWDAESGQPQMVLRGHTDGISSVAYSPDGRWIVTGSNDVRVWDAKTGEQRIVLYGHTNYISSVAFSPDGQWILTASGDKTARVSRWADAEGLLAEAKSRATRELSCQERARYLHQDLDCDGESK